jgi:hypothetical protein
MSTSTTLPISPNWTNTPLHDDVAAAKQANTQELAHAVGTLNVADIAPHAAELAAAITEITMTANTGWPVSHDDPVVVLLRILAKLSLDAPEVESERAADLIAKLAA